MMNQHEKVPIDFIDHITPNLSKLSIIHPKMGAYPRYKYIQFFVLCSKYIHKIELNLTGEPKQTIEIRE